MPRGSPKYATSSPQELTISNLIQSFQAGDMETYRDSQRIWIDDRNPAVEKVLGFAKPYRDPYWVQAEFEGVVGIVDAKETKVLIKLTPPNSVGIYHGRTAIMQTKIEAWVRSRRSVRPAKFHKPTRSDFRTAEWMEVLTLTSSHLVISSYCFSIFLGVNLPNVSTSPS